MRQETRFTLRLDPETHAKADLVAESLGMSLNTLIARAIQDTVSAYELREVTETVTRKVVRLKTES